MRNEWRRLGGCLALAIGLLPGCAADGRSAASQPAPIEVTTSVKPQASPATEPSPPAFTADVAAAPADRMAHSWRAGCPVPLDELRLLTVSYWGFDDAPHTGELVVAASVADDVVGVFRTLYDRRFPIARMVLVDEYGGDDNRSMAADNTSGFNCRKVPNSSSWSQHAYGLAIDINPCENPYLQADGTISPPDCARYTNRSVDERGMIHAGDAVVDAFATIGWEWGGDWRTPDYQHFAVPR